MANKFKEQLDFARQANELTKKRMENEKFIDSTLQDRSKILDNIVANEKDISKLTNIQKDITSKINNLNKTGHTEAAKRYKTEQKIVTNKIKEIKLQQMANNLIEGATEAANEVDSAFGGIGSSIKGFVLNPLTAGIALLLAFNAQQETIAKQFGGIGVTKFRDELAGAN